MARRPVPEGIRITKVGLWYILLSVLVAVAATNTGNNALYLVLAAMLGLLIVSGVISRRNLQRLSIALVGPGEVFAKRPFRIPFTVENGSRFLPRWLLQLSLGENGAQLLIPYLPHRASSKGEVDLMLPRRGRHRLDAVHLSTLFPMGFIRKGLRYSASLELMVFPELFAAATTRVGSVGRSGDDTVRRSGRGHELHALRAFRSGDDPREIHWKKTARSGSVVFTEREAEESRRLSILFDNGFGDLEDPAAEARFEHLVSEAATAAVDHLGRGFEVELVTRGGRVPFAGGARQRLALLEALALVETAPRGGPMLEPSDPRVPTLRLAYAPAEARPA
ncbi:MAG: DUF58 domain-containing protein [Acidobacteriota bacterium]